MRETKKGQKTRGYQIAAKQDLHIYDQTETEESVHDVCNQVHIKRQDISTCNIDYTRRNCSTQHGTKQE